MIADKYKVIVEQRIRDTLHEWANKASVEEKEIYRFLHNLKGTAGTIGMKEIEEEADLKLSLYSDVGTRTFTYSEWYGVLELLFTNLFSEDKDLTPSDGLSTQEDTLLGKIGHRILIIDDDVELAAYLKGLLEERGYPVNIALTAERGLKLFYDWKPDLILLDIHLPDTNGLEVLMQIIGKSQKERSPVIVISTEDTKELRMHIYQNGAMDFFAKPIDSELFLALIDNRFQLKNHWEQSIIVDELTGAYNRKHFDKVMKHLIAEYKRAHHHFTVVMMDLDYFKRVNDNYGHLAGDEVLRRFAEIVMAAKRVEDIFCRYGGEEFVLVLPNTNKESAAELIQRIRQLLSSEMFTWAGEKFSVTFTAGITEIDEHNAQPEKMVEEADQALYLGKQSGRNQTVLYSRQLQQMNSMPMLHILIVDDDPLIRDIIVSQFTAWQPNRKFQISVKGYESGPQLLDSDWYIERDKYIILLDGAMPVMDGVEVLKKLRDDYPERDIVIAMLTARMHQVDIIHALQLGADDYIIKPFQLSELVSRVERLVLKVFK